MRYLHSHVAVLIAAAFGALASPADAAPTSGDELVWNAAAAEHLLNRAGFGASPPAIRAALEAGLEATVEELLRGPVEPAMPFYAERLAQRDMTTAERSEMQSMMQDADMRREATRERRARDRAQLQVFRTWWVQAMVAGEDPLRERMTLFWHGYFTSASRDVKSSFEMIRQNQLLREHALGSFGELLHGIARDPAMLEYLDNDANRKGKPNENFARELMELFTLGEGNYTEADVKEAARAFTGYTDKDGEFIFRKKRHDRGRKSVLGVKGRLKGEDVIDILIEHPASARWVAGRLLEYFEGVAPEPERHERYADVLRANGFDLSTMLGTLFRDPAFYRDEVVGTRIASPVDYLVGAVRRLEADVPAALLVGGASSLGEELLNPPNVKGWEGGRAWIQTSSLLQRANLVASFLGLTELRETLTSGDRSAMGLSSLSWRPSINLTWMLRRAGVATDAEIVEYLGAKLLAVPLSETSRAELMLVIDEERQGLGASDAPLLDEEFDAEGGLRRLAHMILSLPEGHLH